MHNFSHKTSITKFQSQILATKIQSQNFSPKISVEKFQSQNFSHRISGKKFSHQISVTKFQSPNFSHQSSVTKFQSQNFSHKISVTKCQSQNFSHKISGQFTTWRKLVQILHKIRGEGPPQICAKKNSLRGDPYYSLHISEEGGRAPLKNLQNLPAL